MTEADFGKLLKEYDKRDMAGFTRCFVQDFENAISAEIGIEEDRDWSGIICLGMGGSAAGGMFLKALSDDFGGLPVIVWRDYGLPSWWGPEWLVIATSYSGNTEETLDGVREAILGGGTIVGISSGGELERILSESEESICLRVPSGQMPRSAFGHIFGTQISACWALGIFPRPSKEDISDMISRLSLASSKSDLLTNSGMVATFSRSLVGKELGIVSPSCLSPAAYRFVCQLNENSAKFARSTEIPEMNHNEIVAWTRGISDNNSLILLRCEGLHLRNNMRIEWMLGKVQASPTWVIDCEGNTLLERLLYASHITDWISIGLAVLTGEDPSDMPAIVSLKDYLCESQ